MYLFLSQFTRLFLLVSSLPDLQGHTFILFGTYIPHLWNIILFSDSFVHVWFPSLSSYCCQLMLKRWVSLLISSLVYPRRNNISPRFGTGYLFFWSQWRFNKESVFFYQREFIFVPLKIVAPANCLLRSHLFSPESSLYFKSNKLPANDSLCHPESSLSVPIKFSLMAWLTMIER